MKRLFALAMIMLMAFMSLASATIENPVLNYLETKYGSAIAVEENAEQTIIEFCEYKVLLQDNLVVGLYNYSTGIWEDPSLERKKLETLLQHYSVISVKQDESGMYLSICRYDNLLEWKFYYEEYYVDPDTGNIVYYNSNERISVGKTKAYYNDDVVFNLLNW